MTSVIVSAAQMRQRFHGCEPDYIRDVCHAACCRSSVSPTGTLVAVMPSEEAAIKGLGAEIKNGLIQPRPGEKHCPFEGPTHLCELHAGPHKPWGCRSSPFTLSPSGKRLVVRNRYRLLRCYKDGDNPKPAYLAFYTSLETVMGSATAQDIRHHLDAGGGDKAFPMAPAALAWLQAKTRLSKAGRRK